jgi:hypothetical protein
VDPKAKRVLLAALDGDLLPALAEARRIVLAALREGPLLQELQALIVQNGEAVDTLLAALGQVVGGGVGGGGVGFSKEELLLLDVTSAEATLEAWFASLEALVREAQDGGAGSRRGGGAEGGVGGVGGVTGGLADRISELLAAQSGNLKRGQGQGQGQRPRAANRAA